VNPGYTRAEALRNIQDIARMVVDSLVEHGEALPSEKFPFSLCFPRLSGDRIELVESTG